MAASSEQRELDLVDKVDFRILNVANNEKKLQELLGKFLAPLLLKGASEHASVRAKVATIAQRLKVFIEPPGIVLPVAALVHQFKTTESPVVRHLDTVFIRHSIDRLSAQERRDVIPALLTGISKENSSTAALFSILLRSLSSLRLPPRGSKEDESFRSDLGLSDPADAAYVADWFGKLFLLTKTATVGATSDEQFFFFDFEASWLRVGTNLAETRIKVASLLGSGAFTGDERFMAALYAAGHKDSRVSSAGEELLKRSTVSLEDKALVAKLFQAHALLPPPYRIRILNLLSRSAVSATYTDEILDVVQRDTVPSTIESAEHAAHAHAQPRPGNASGGSGSLVIPRLERTKLSKALFEYINWVARMASGKKAFTIGRPLVASLQLYITDQGWPDPTNVVGSDFVPLRAQAYETIGMLARGADMTMAERLALSKWFFRALAEDPTAAVVVNIDGALSSMTSLFAPDKDKDSADPDRETVDVQLRALLLKYISLSEDEPHVHRSARHAAAKWANHCLPFADPVARWIDILAAAGRRGERSDVVEEGHKGLDPWTYYSNHADALALPSWQALVQTFFKQPIGHGEAGEAGEATAAAATATAAADMDVDSVSNFVNFAGDAIDAFPLAVNYCKRVLFLSALPDFKVEPGWELQLDTLVHSDKATRDTIRRYLAQDAHRSGLVDLLTAAFDGMLRPQPPTLAEPCSRGFVDLAALAPQTATAALAPRAAELLVLVRSNKKEIRQLGAAALGILGAHPANDDAAVAQLKATLVTAAQPWKTAVGSELNATEGAFLALAHLLSRRVFYGAADRAAPLVADVATLLPSAKEIAEAFVSFQDALFDALSQLWTAGIPCFPGAEDKDNKSVIVAFVDVLQAQAKKGNERAIGALGRLALATGSDGPAAGSEEKGKEEDDTTALILGKLYDLYELKQVEVHFAVGGAITAAVACWDSDVVELSLDVEGGSGGDSHSQNSFRVPKRSARLAAALDKILADCKTTKPSLLKASGIWLFSIIQHSSHLPEIQSRLRACQVAFMRLLSARDELVQETASRGLSLVYEKGDASLKDDLVRDLVASFTGSGTQLKVDDDTELFDAGALPTGEGKSVTSYKDIVSLANEVGDQTLIYKFMSLAANAATWSTRSAFGRFGLSSILSESEVDPKLYPKLFRYRFDPNPNVQRSMNDIWKALVKDSHAVVEAHLDAIMADLLKSILGKEWRVRQASCAALSDLVQGRPFAQYGKYYEDIWAKALKVLDDVKGSVREAALRLCVTLSNTLVRQLEEGGGSSGSSGSDAGTSAKASAKPAKHAKTKAAASAKSTSAKSTTTTTTTNATAMMSQALPFLMSDKGIESGVEDVKIFATVTVLKIAKHGGKALRPYIAGMVCHLLGLLSTIEPQAFNYYYMRSGDEDKGKLDKMRSAMVSQSPISEAVENCLRHVDAAVMDDLAPGLEAAIKSAVGMSTKIGCGRVLATLATRHGADFAPHAGRFLLLLEKQALDRNDEVSQSYAKAAAYVMRSAPDPAREHFAARFVDLYLASEDETRRQRVADAVLALSKISPDHFAALETRLLPLAYLASHDADDYVHKACDEVWGKHAGSSLSVARYVPEIAALIQRTLDTAQWALKHAGALTAADALRSVLGASDLSGHVNEAHLRTLWPLYQKALALKTFPGKEKLLDVLPDLVRKGQPLWASDAKIAAALRKMTLVEAKRNNDAYRVHAFRCLWRVAAARDDDDMWPDLVAIVTPHLEKLRAWEDRDKDDGDHDRMDVDGGNKTRDAAAEKLVRQTAENGLEAVARGYSRPALKKDPEAVLQAIWTALAPFLGSDAFHLVRRTVWYKAATDLFTAAAEAAEAAEAEAAETKTSGEGPAYVLHYLDSLDARNPDAGTEAQRAARAQAIKALVLAAQKGAFGPASADACVGARAQALAALQAALATERSLDVQKLLKEAAAAAAST